jgi:hypothetical protein
LNHVGKKLRRLNSIFYRAVEFFLFSLSFSHSSSLIYRWIDSARWHQCRDRVNSGFAYQSPWGNPVILDLGLDSSLGWIFLSNKNRLYFISCLCGMGWLKKWWNGGSGKDHQSGEA